MEVLRNARSKFSLRIFTTFVICAAIFFCLNCCDDVNPTSSANLPNTISEAIQQGYYNERLVSFDTDNNKYVVHKLAYKNSLSISHDSNLLDGLYLSKLDETQNLFWKIFFWRVTITHIKVDNDGNCFVVGTFYGTAYFGKKELTSLDRKDGFYLKISSDGEIIWLKQAGSEDHDYIDALAISRFGELYITGNFYNIGFAEDGPYYLAKISTTGDLLWTNDATESNASKTGKDICLDENGNVIVTGNSDFISKFSENGNLIWEKHFTNTNGRAIVTDANGNITTSGFFVGSVDFGDVIYTTEDYMDIYIAQFSSSGNFLWSKLISAEEKYEPIRLKVDNNDDLFIAGRFCGNIDFDGNVFETDSCGIYMAKFEHDGNFVWSTYFEW